MLDILHNGVTKKVDGSLKETDGLLVISGKPKWLAYDDMGHQVDSNDAAAAQYGFTFVDPRIKTTHTIQSIKATTKRLLRANGSPAFSTVITDLTNSMVMNVIRSDTVTIIINDATIVQNDPVVTITMYDTDAAETPSGMEAVIRNAVVTFTDWKLDKQIIEEEGTFGRTRLQTIFTGTVAVKIEDDGASAASLANVVDSSFVVIASDTDESIRLIQASGIKEILPDGRLVCYVMLTPSDRDVEMEDLVLPTTVEFEEGFDTVNYVYIASDNVRMALPEVDVEWEKLHFVAEKKDDGSWEQIWYSPSVPLTDPNMSGVDYYEATFSPEFVGNVHLSDVIVVYGENGEKFPMEMGPALNGRPKMYSYITEADDHSKSIVVRWERDTMPETTKLTAEVYAANY